MKILRIIRSMNPQAGGPVEGIHQMTQVLRSRGIETEIISLDSSDDPWIKTASTTVHALGPVQGTYGFSGRLVPWLSEHFKNYDTAIIHGLWQYHSLGAWRVFRKAAFPYFIYTHGMLDPWFKEYYPLKHLKKWCYWPWAEYRVLRDASGVIFTTNQERLLARQSFWLYRAKEMVLPYGIQEPRVGFDSMRKKFTQEHPRSEKAINLVFLARLHPKKRLELLIEAFAQLVKSNPNLVLWIGGSASDSVYENELKRFASEKLGESSQSIQWLGFVSGEKKYEMLASADLYVMPSYQENFGISAVEAIAMGVPVILSKGVNLGEDLVKAQIGAIFDGTLQDLIFKMEMALASGLKLSNERRSEISAYFKKHYDLESNADDWIKAIFSRVEKCQLKSGSL